MDTNALDFFFIAFNLLIMISYQNIYIWSLASINFRTATRKIYKHHYSVDIIHVLGNSYIGEVLKVSKQTNMILPDFDTEPIINVPIKYYSVNALTLSEILLIPRTTVLRCLRTLIEQNYVNKNKYGYYINQKVFRKDTLHIYQKYFLDLNKISTF